MMAERVAAQYRGKSHRSILSLCYAERRDWAKLSPPGVTAFFALYFRQSVRRTRSATGALSVHWSPRRTIR